MEVETTKFGWMTTPVQGRILLAASSYTVAYTLDGDLSDCCVIGCDNISAGLAVNGVVNEQARLLNPEVQFIVEDNFNNFNSGTGENYIDVHINGTGSSYSFYIQALRELKSSCEGF